MVNGFDAVPVIPVASVPQTKSPAALVSTESQDVSVLTLSPPVKTWMPAKEEVAEVPSEVTVTPCAKVEVPVVEVARTYPV